MNKLHALSLSLLLAGMLVGCGDSEPSSTTTTPNNLETSSINKGSDKAAAVANSRPVFATAESRSFMAHDDGATKRGIAHSYTKNSKTFTDNNTHLTWQDSEISYKNYNQALTYCQSLTLDGVAGWRLPEMRELQTLQDFSHLGGGKY